MTIPNSPEQKLIEGLNTIAKLQVYQAGGPPTCIVRDAVEAVLPIARSLLAELAELREKAEALEWLFPKLKTVDWVWLFRLRDRNMFNEKDMEGCPVYLKQLIEQMIEQKERT